MTPPTKRSHVVALDQFTSKTHTTLTPTIDPSLITLPSPFVVIVFGASEGIGYAIALAYARAKASGIIISSRNTSALDTLASEVKSISPSTTVSIIPCDVTSASSVSEISAKIESQFSRLDAVVTAFGFSGPVYLKMTESVPADIQTCFDVNCMGTYHIAHYLIPLLLSSPDGAASFLCISSLASSLLTGPIANFGYATSKLAQHRLIEFLDCQYNDVNNNQDLLAISIHPGAIPTPTALISTPDVFRPYLTDSVDLAGGVCVWLVKDRRSGSGGDADADTNVDAANANHKHDSKQWLSGRMISATWDFDELMQRREEIVEKDLLTLRMLA